jgi:DNA-binding PadR family transcriptional regulator
MLLNDFFMKFRIDTKSRRVLLWNLDYQYNPEVMDMNYGRELLKGNTDALLLCMIYRQPMYGYQIIKELERRSNGYFQFKEGTLYPALHRLEKIGLIAGEWEKLANGQDRRYYRITLKGQEVLQEKLSVWAGFSGAVNAVLAPATI